MTVFTLYVKLVIDFIYGIVFISYIVFYYWLFIVEFDFEEFDDYGFE